MQAPFSLPLRSVTISCFITERKVMSIRKTILFNVFFAANAMFLISSYAWADECDPGFVKEFFTGSRKNSENDYICMKQIGRRLFFVDNSSAVTVYDVQTKIVISDLGKKHRTLPLKIFLDQSRLLNIMYDDETFRYKISGSRFSGIDVVPSSVVEKEKEPRVTMGQEVSNDDRVIGIISERGDFFVQYITDRIPRSLLDIYFYQALDLNPELFVSSTFYVYGNMQTGARLAFNGGSDFERVANSGATLKSFSIAKEADDALDFYRKTDGSFKVEGVLSDYTMLGKKLRQATTEELMDILKVIAIRSLSIKTSYDEQKLVKSYVDEATGTRFELTRPMQLRPYAHPNTHPLSRDAGLDLLKAGFKLTADRGQGPEELLFYSVFTEEMIKEEGYVNDMMVLEIFNSDLVLVVPNLNGVERASYPEVLQRYLNRRFSRMKVNELDVNRAFLYDTNKNQISYLKTSISESRKSLISKNMETTAEVGPYTVKYLSSGQVEFFVVGMRFKVIGFSLEEIPNIDFPPTGNTFSLNYKENGVKIYYLKNDLSFFSVVKKEPDAKFDCSKLLDPIDPVEGSN